MLVADVLGVCVRRPGGGSAVSGGAAQSQTEPVRSRPVRRLDPVRWRPRDYGVGANHPPRIQSVRGAVILSAIAIDIRDSVAWITLTSPPVNKLSMALINELSAALLELRLPEVRVVVIRAAPGRRSCA